MKRLPKYTPAEVRNDPYGFTYKEMSEVIGENEAKALYEELYKQLPRKKNLSMLVKNICKSSDTEKYVYELKDNNGKRLRTSKTDKSNHGMGIGLIEETALKYNGLMEITMNPCVEPIGL